jgi:flagellar biosynthetic protein FlhB
MGSQVRRTLLLSLPGWIQQKDALTLVMVGVAYRQALATMLLTLAPLFASAMVLAVLAHMGQTRGLVSTEALHLKTDRINPLNGFKRLFSSRSIAELVKALAKIAVMVAATFDALRDGAARMTFLLQNDLPVALALVVDLLQAMALRCAAVLAGLSILDLAYQWWRFEKDLRMTKEEVKEEFKQMDGNPQTRGRIRQIQRQMATRRMMQDVPKASLVITNPTHFAIALRYNPGEDRAPVVLAKGQDLIAQRIKSIASEHQIVQVENRPLARLLFRSAEVGRQIPVELYGAVAEVLAYVTRLKEGHRS